MSRALPDWTALDWPAHHRVVEANGQPIHLVEMGPPAPHDAPPILFLHGWTGCWQHWVEQFGPFSDDHRVIAIDLPGFGGSPLPEADISIQAYAETVVDLLDALELDRVTLVGSSMGGGVAAQVALSTPQRVERLVLVSATGISPRYLGLPTPLLRHRFNRRVNSLVLRETTLPKRVAYRLASRPRLRYGALGWVVKHPSRLSGPMAVELISGGGRPAAATAAVALASEDISDRLGEIACPTLVLWGDSDRVVGVGSGRRFAEGIPDAELRVFEDTGHLPFIERPRDFNDELRRFMNRENGHTALTMTSTDVTSPSDKIVTH